jgi:Winged helix-turn-helix domain (DUF2582)
MDMEIGEAAGRIWQYLAEHGETTLRQLQRETTLSERLLHMGVGWLAREDKLCFRQARGSLKLALHTVSASMVERSTPQPRPREITTRPRGLVDMGGRAREAFL